MKKALFYFVLLVLLIGCGGGAETAVSPTTAPAEEVAPATDASGEILSYAIGTEESAPRTFTIVSEESTASYLVDEEFFADALTKLNIQPGEADVIGSTQDINGELVIDFGNGDLLESGSFTVNLVSLATDQNRRDEYIRDNHLESNKFPEATFTATAVSGLPETYTEGEEIAFDLTGDLSIRDVTIEATFNVTAVLRGGRLTGEARLPIAMSTFGIEPPNFANTLKVADDFVIKVEFTAVES